MGYAIVWTEPAVADLEAICAYIAERNLTAAQRIGQAIVAHAEILRSFPYIGPVYPPGSRGPHREITYKNYRIFYRVSEEIKQVEILTVWHGARAEPELPG